MTVYYNEQDKFAAAWLRELIAAGHIAPGDVDERSIEDVKPADLLGYTQCHFFAGIGVWSLALRRAGVSDDTRVWTGSCPCQPFSSPGKGAGFADERHLWPAWHHLIAQCRPAIVFGEQVANASDWIVLVRSDLEAMGYAVGAIPIEAASAGAFNLRPRLFFVADAEGDRWGEERPHASGGAERDSAQGLAPGSLPSGACFLPAGLDGKRRPIEPGLEPLAHAPAARVGRLRAYGNAIDAEAARIFIESVM